MSIYGNLLEESYLIEFSGNEAKNNEYKEILKEIEELMDAFVKRFNLMNEYLDKMVEAQRSIIKKPNTFKDNLEKCKGFIPEYKEKCREIFKDTTPAQSWHKLRKKSKTFNNKYSNVMIEYKKELEKKIIKDLTDVRNVLYPWSKDQTKCKESLSNFDKLKVLDESYHEVFFSLFGELYCMMFDEYQAIYGDVFYICSCLNVDIEKSIKWKLVHAIFKK